MQAVEVRIHIEELGSDGELEFRVAFSISHSDICMLSYRQKHIQKKQTF